MGGGKRDRDYGDESDAAAEQDVVGQPGNVDFGGALRALKAGHRVCRAGWNGKGMWLSLSGCLVPQSVPAGKFWSQNNAEYAIQNGGSAKVLPSITMKTATGEILMGWLASQTDMLAEDWQVLPPLACEA